MKNIFQFVSVLYNNPFKLKYPTPKRYFFLHKILPAFVFLVLLSAYSCKTCNCPAYSYRYNPGQEQVEPAAQKSDAERILPDTIKIFNTPLPSNPSQS